MVLEGIVMSRRTLIIVHRLFARCQRRKLEAMVTTVGHCNGHRRSGTAGWSYKTCQVDVTIFIFFRHASGAVRIASLRYTFLTFFSGDDLFGN